MGLLSASDMASIGGVLAQLLDQTATVYGKAVTGGASTVVLYANLPCALQAVDVRPAATGVARSELAALRRLSWLPTYAMPEAVQVVVDGVRWRPVAGTFARFPETGTPVERTCDVVRMAGTV